MRGAVDLDTARSLVKATCRPLEVETVAVRDAVGHTLACDVTAAEPVPSADVAAMDGICVRADRLDARGPAIRVAGEIPAGQVAALPEGCAIGISTGAALPPGADTVIRRERFEWIGEHHREARVTSAVPRGSDVRRAGEDFQVGQGVLAAGRRIDARALGALIAAGVRVVETRRPPRVAVLTTGDEVRGDVGSLGPGEVRDVSLPALGELASGLGASWVYGAHVRDRPRELADQLARACAAADLVVVAGGLGPGPHDHSARAWRTACVQTVFERVRVRPGRPTRCGVSAAGTAILGVPGNPGAAFVMMLVLGIGALAGLRCEAVPERWTLPLDRAVERRTGDTRLLRCGLAGQRAVVLAAQGAHQVSSLPYTALVAELAPGPGAAPAGSAVPCVMYPSGVG